MSGEQDPVDWLRAQVEADKSGAESWLSTRTAAPYDTYERPVQSRKLDTVADCEAKLAILVLCEEATSWRGSPEDEGWHDGRDPDEQMRDEALADLAGDIIALVAGAYRHRPGWARHWACPGCRRPLRELPDGHGWAISVEDGTWSCTDAEPLSPQEFMNGR